jgi:hypothetical protein
VSFPTCTASSTMSAKSVMKLRGIRGRQIMSKILNIWYKVRCIEGRDGRRGGIRNTTALYTLQHTQSTRHSTRHSTSTTTTTTTHALSVFRAGTRFQLCMPLSSANSLHIIRARVISVISISIAIIIIVIIIRIVRHYHIVWQVLTLSLCLCLCLCAGCNII